LFHSLALAPDGSIVAWGNNYLGQVSGAPSGTGFSAIAGGDYHSLALAGELPPVAQTKQSNPELTPSSLNINALWDRDLDGVLDTGDNCLETPNPSQLDADGDGFGNACDADLNNDGAVGLDDINAILGAAGTANNPAADINGDGWVGLDDASAALGMLGTPPGPSAQTCPGTGPCSAGGM
jgi:hypothetical protein